MKNEVQRLRDTLAVQARQLQDQQQQIEQLEKLLNASSPPGAAQKMMPATPAAAPTADISDSIVKEPQLAALTSSTTDATATSQPSSAPDAATQGFEKNPPQTASIRFKGITLTPGGFMAAETVWRQRALSADVNTPFNSVPMPGASQSNISEFNASGRQSRISMLAKGALSNVKVGGYYEADFLSAGTTSNSNESNSYTFRQRQFWAQAAFQSGWTITGGQMWSLVTEYNKGLDPRSEALPMTIDAEYEVGFSWARQYGLRVVKDFGNKVWLGMSVENPQTTFGAHGQTGNFLLGAAGSGGGLFNPTSNYSFNAAPDLIFKAAFEPGFGHYEVFGILSTFRDRVFRGAAAPYNDTRMGGGIGANARVTFAKHIVAGLHFLGGDGIGRYGSAGLPDATVRPDGTLALIRDFQSNSTLEFHTKKLDIYTNVGGEYAARTAYISGTGTIPNEGYGAIGFNNSGCWTEPTPSSSGFGPGALANCVGDTKNLIEGTIGFWYRFYKGSKGTVQFGSQYSYVARNTWSGVGTASGTGASGAPHNNDNMVFTSFRYYLP